MPYELLTLRLLHVVGGIFWVGGGLYSTIFLAPALAKAGPAAGLVMGEMQRRHLFTVLPTVAVLTMLSGIRLMWIASGGFDGAYFDRPSGLTYAVAGAASVVAFVFALLVARPAGVRMGQLGARMAAAAESERTALQAEFARARRQSGVATAWAMVLLTASAIGMAVARYL